jgi:hypothetical protein
MAAAAAGGGALCFLLCSIQMTVGPVLFKWRIVLIYPFNLQSNVVTSISLSWLVQIWYCFLIFSKITIYTLISLFSVHSVCWVMFICLILFFVSTTYKEYLFYTTISDGTLHFVSLRWTQGFVTFSNAYEFEHVAKCGKVQCSSKHSRKLCERCRYLYTSI